VSESVSEHKVLSLLERKPKYYEILSRIVDVEEAAEKGLHEESEIIKKIGWEWHHVRALPAELMILVREGIIEVQYKSSRYTHYRLKDKEVVKRALMKFKSQSKGETP
jgi:hypothetical protein